MKMKKRSIAKTTLACMLVTLMLALTMMGQIAHATNESSYRLGFSGAVRQYQCLAHSPELVCSQDGYAFNPSDVPCSANDFKEMTNETACGDGYADGFAHWCAGHESDCAKLTRDGAIPEMTRN